MCWGGWGGHQSLQTFRSPAADCGRCAQSHLMVKEDHLVGLAEKIRNRDSEEWGVILFFFLTKTWKGDPNVTEDKDGNFVLLIQTIFKGNNSAGCGPTPCVYLPLVSQLCIYVDIRWYRRVRILGWATAVLKAQYRCWIQMSKLCRCLTTILIIWIRCMSWRRDAS